MHTPPEESRAVAVIGASENRRKFGNKCVRAYDHAGWRVYPVNPGADEIEGHRCYPRLAAIADPLDRVAIYLPPPRTRRLLQLLPRNAEIFFNPGTADAEVLEEARAAGLDVHAACAIVAIGLSPAQFGE